MTDRTSWNEGLVYRPNRRPQWAACLLTLGIGGLLVAIGVLHPAPGNPIGVRLMIGGLSLGIGVVTLLSIMAGLPRLTADPMGLKLQSLLRRQAADWNDLGPFRIATFRSRYGRSKSCGVARRFGSSKTFTIPDAFTVPIDTVLYELADLRGGQGARFLGDMTALEPEYGVTEAREPWLTVLMINVFIAIFIAEKLLEVVPGTRSLSLNTLIAMGGLSWAWVGNGEWWRLLSAAFLHADGVHLVGNMVAFAISGITLERLIGRAWTFCIFIAGALAGSAVSLILTTSLVSVGASGGILAMLAAQVVVGNRLPAGRARTRTVSRPIGLAIPALLPFGTSTGGIQVDYGAHVGGAVLGIALGVFLLRTWRESEPLPGFRGVAMAAAIVALVSLAGTAFAVTLSYPARKSAVALIPASLVPHTKAERSANSYRLVSEYPGDPRSHMMVALMFYDEHNMPSAETELREALAQDDIYRTVLGPGLKNTIRFFLAETVMFEGRRADAVELARQACQAPFSSQPDRTVATVQMRARLCPP